jgi:hypothetical protein
VEPDDRACTSNGGEPFLGPRLNRAEILRRLGARTRTSETERYDGTPCELWTGHIDRDGYGNRLQVEGVVTSPHRMAYWAAFGAIPAGMQIDHRCHDPRVCPSDSTCPHRRCVNPLHLEAVTPRENTLRSGGPAARNARTLICVNGHVWDKVHASGRRRCSICDREVAREQYRRRSEKERERTNARRRALDAGAARQRRKNRAALLAKRGLRPDECLNGHRYEDGSFTVGAAGRRVCLVCWRLRNAARKGPAAQAG